MSRIIGLDLEVKKPKKAEPKKEEAKAEPKAEPKKKKDE